MGVFVDYTSNLFASVDNTPTTLLETGLNSNPHILVVNGLIVCNLGGQTIRFNLQKTRDQSTPVTISYIKNYEIKANQTVDLVKDLGIEIFLTYSVLPSITESLSCFSGATIQKFDCEISYTRLNETPTGL